MPTHIGTLAFAPTLKANPAAKAKEPIFPPTITTVKNEIVTLQ